MKYKLQRKNNIYKPALNFSKWTVSKLKEEKEQTATTNTNQQWENVKYAITTAAKETLGKLKQQPRKPWISEKTITPIEQRRKHKHDKTKVNITNLEIL